MTDIAPTVLATATAREISTAATEIVSLLEAAAAAWEAAARDSAAGFQVVVERLHGRLCRFEVKLDRLLILADATERAVAAAKGLAAAPRTR